MGKAKDIVWVEVLAIHIDMGGGFYRGEIRRLDRMTAEDWIAQTIVRAVPDPSKDADLPWPNIVKKLDPTVTTVADLEQREGRVFDLDIADGQIGAKSTSPGDAA